MTTRGQNLWALYSAFTNYATYADERNGFKLRETGNDTQAYNMLLREYDAASGQYPAVPITCTGSIT